MLYARDSVLQRVAVCCSVLQCVAVCCSVLQCVAVCCSVLQCVAVCCSVLQCFVSWDPASGTCVQGGEGAGVRERHAFSSTRDCVSFFLSVSKPGCMCILYFNDNRVRVVLLCFIKPEDVEECVCHPRTSTLCSYLVVASEAALFPCFDFTSGYRYRIGTVRVERLWALNVSHETHHSVTINIGF